MSSVTRQQSDREANPRSIVSASRQLRTRCVKASGRNAQELLDCRRLRLVASGCVPSFRVRGVSSLVPRLVASEFVQPSRAGQSPRSVLRGALSRLKKAATARIQSAVAQRLAAPGSKPRSAFTRSHTIGSVAFRSVASAFEVASGAGASPAPDSRPARRLNS